MLLTQLPLTSDQPRWAHNWRSLSMGTFLQTCRARVTPQRKVRQPRTQRPERQRVNKWHCMDQLRVYSIPSHSGFRACVCVHHGPCILIVSDATCLATTACVAVAGKSIVFEVSIMQLSSYGFTEVQSSVLLFYRGKVRTQRIKPHCVNICQTGRHVRMSCVVNQGVCSAWGATCESEQDAR